jgi:regulatory protein
MRRGATALPEITALTPSTRRQGRVHLYLDGRFAASLDAMTAATHHLRVGQVLTPDDVAALEREAVIARLVDRALRFLGFRPRSEAELRTYLRRHEAMPEQVDAVLAELRRLGLVDDAAFARYWRAARDQAAPRGERLLRAELRAKGVAADEVAAVLPAAEEEAALARRAAERPLRGARALPWPEFRAKLLGYLQRRGFSYETASRTARDLWEELTNERPDADEEG